MKRAVGIAFVIAVAGCSRFAVSNAVPQGPQSTEPLVLGGHKIQHVIVIVQENRTVDNLFNGFPGANTARSGKNSAGETVYLRAVPLAAPYDIGHKHEDWLAEYNGGQMNGFNLDSVKCYSNKSGHCPPAELAPYHYVPRHEVKQYWTLAQRYVFADNTFETSQGPSFPAHQYLVSGTSTIDNDARLRAASNANYPGKRHEGGCDSAEGTRVDVINQDGNWGKPIFPCFGRTSIMDRMNAAGVTWRYYQARGGHGQWNAPDAIKSIRFSKSYRNVIWPSHKFLDDVARGHLAQVTYITPTADSSDHPAHNNGTGPAWVASVVNAVGKSKFWDSSAIFIVWDDWGGWFDHVKPTVYNSYELGFRVPMIVVGPYAKSGYVSHDKHEFGSILKFVEEAFHVKSLGTTDDRSDNLSDCFDFSKPPQKFTPIPGALDNRYFVNRPESSEEPGD